MFGECGEQIDDPTTKKYIFRAAITVTHILVKADLVNHGELAKQALERRYRRHRNALIFYQRVGSPNLFKKDGGFRKKNME